MKKHGTYNFSNTVCGLKEDNYHNADVEYIITEKDKKKITCKNCVRVSKSLDRRDLKWKTQRKKTETFAKYYHKKLAHKRIRISAHTNTTLQIINLKPSDLKKIMKIL